ncbi:hypothetical protein [Labilibaculum sp.]|uniref:hypothetical protein n=1 Tax=Labilibaculum sp. TaxID=2060723 RepID=UPI002AA730A6|nr:hypothetical protein [Labilibaculum sp.]
MDTIYLIKARVQITSKNPYVSYKPLPVKGLFFPKGKKKRHADIEEQCREHVVCNLQNDHPDLSFNISSIKIESFSYGFVINEKKNS